MFDVGARLPKFPLGGLAEKKSLAVTNKQVNWQKPQSVENYPEKPLRRDLASFLLFVYLSGHKQSAVGILTTYNWSLY